MLRLIRTHSAHPDFVSLVQQLDQDLAERDGKEHDFYAQFNTLTAIQHVVVAYEEGVAVACGAMKELDKNTMEIKRMFTTPAHRAKGIASLVLGQLETWAKESGYTVCRLETGKRQPEAIAVYQKNGYVQIPNYGQYAGIENSVCFEKKLL
ncbi:MAG: GNAT family N-acetyltransferase [Chitinophagaceae bacterium]|nr:MAG: GNAT family N-acetyltransferase [Chitinophagaceae bacterium]